MKSWLVIALAGFLLAGPALGQIFSEQTRFTAQTPYGPYIPPETWIPIDLEFRNDTNQTIDGQAILPVTARRNAADLALPVSVPAHTRTRVQGWWYMPGDLDWSKLTSGYPITVAEWRDRNGTLIGRYDVLGRPAAEAPGGDLVANQPTAYLLSFGMSPETADAFDAGLYCRLLTSFAGFQVLPSLQELSNAPRDARGYSSIRFAVLDYGQADSFDPAQRQALLDFVERGGNLVIPAPRGETDIINSWLLPYLPVQILGQRLVNRIELTGEQPIRCLEYVPMIEAADNAGGQVVLRDAANHYVHAAYRSYGLGRIVFTSFPISALDTRDPHTAQIAGRLWRQLLHLHPSGTQMRATQLQEQRLGLIQAMLGRSTISWRTAASVAGGFVLAVVLVQLLIGGPRRPWAFLLGAGLSIALALALVALAVVRTGQQQVMGAQIALLEPAPDGGGTEHEILAYLGKDDVDFSLTAVDSDTTIQPVVSKRDNPPVINLQPFAVPQAGMHALRIERVWESHGMLGPEMLFSAIARFTPEGLEVSVDNALDQTLEAPIFSWNNACFSLPDVPAGKSQLRPERRNPAGQFVNILPAFISDTAKLRGQILQALHTPAGVSSTFQSNLLPAAVLSLWLPQPAPSLLQPGLKLAALRSQSLLHVPVTIEPAAPGQQVRIDPGFMQIFSTGSIPFYNAVENAWLGTNLETSMLVGFAPPPQLGQLRPTQATLFLDLSAPEQVITLRRGQCPGGKPLANLQGPVVAEWRQPRGLQQMSFTPEPGDYDAQGNVWLHLTVASQSSTPGQVLAQWQVQRFELGVDGQITAAPSLLGPPVRLLTAGQDDNAKPAATAPAGETTAP